MFQQREKLGCPLLTRLSHSGKTIWMQEDTATLDDWKPEFIPGGFAGHCVNNAEQRYAYQPNPDGVLQSASPVYHQPYLRSRMS